MHKLFIVAFSWLFTFSSLGYAQNQNPWTEIPMPSPAICAFGTPFAIFVKPGRTDKVVVDFEGGGACWSGATCQKNSSAFKSNIDGESAYFKDPGYWHGIYNIFDSRNPVADATIIHIPYCTGDVHWGNSVKTYKRVGEPSFQVHHAGAINISQALNWIKSNVTVKPASLRVTGCSAGSYGSIYWAPHLKKMFPEAKMLQFGDSGAGVSTAEFRERGLPRWNVTTYAPDWIPGLDPKVVDWTKLSLSDLYIGVANFYKNDGFSQFNHLYDYIQTYFYTVMGGNPLDWSQRMLESIENIHNHNANGNFTSAFSEGSKHCAMTTDLFYDSYINGKKFYEWFESFDHKF